MTGGNPGSFWEGKVPCWDLRSCVPEARSSCIAYLDPSRPCWEHENTLCKTDLGLDTCFSCEVLHRYGHVA